MTTSHDRFAELVKRASNAAQALYPSLTARQLDKVADQIANSHAFSTFRNEGWSRPTDEEFNWQLDAIARDQPAMLEKAPSAADLTADLLAQPGAPSDPVGRLTLARQAAAMTEDERLDKARLLQPVSATAKKSPPAPSRTTDDRPASREKLACEMTQTELNALIEQRMGRPTSQMLASQVRTYSRTLIEASRPTSAPAIEECKAKLAAGKTWRDISPAVRMAASREAQERGTSLPALGLGPK